MLKIIKSFFTMQQKECMFVDKVVGKEVFRFVDCYGDEFMAFGKWDFFKVKIGRK